ncbi:MAG TPA: hypothetical protein VFV86_09960 [Nitrososphaeraceae archaeon]|nr:hypothetical protein [Nitrososphaeraceae archaeon]
MNLELTLFIITIIFFINGVFISYFLRLKFQNHNLTSPKVSYSEVIELLEERKQLQIDTITQKMNEMQIKLDLIEATISQLSKISNNNIKNNNSYITAKPNITSHDILSRDIAHEINSNSSQPAVTYNETDVLTNKHNSTNYYILKILLKEPLTSNEIKNAIGRTREHTARLMKKLFDLKLVDRDVTTKPFKYKLTNEGKKHIEEHLEKNDITSSPSNTPLSDLTH